MFVPLLRPPGPPETPSLVVAVRGSLVRLVDAEPADHSMGIFLGTLAGRHCWAIDADDEPPTLAPASAHDALGPDSFADLRGLWGSIDEPTWIMAGRAMQLIHWARTHRFCGRCGTATTEAEGERARTCPSCGLQAFPRLSPAVIMLVERDDGRALLARNAMFPKGLFSCLAGFVEPGETLEEAVRREVLEEVGLHVDRCEYRGSQPWPFPHSLMVGFGAHYVSGEITVDGTEIAEANWYKPDEAPTFPSTMSIASRLIEGWRSRSPR